MKEQPDVVVCTHFLPAEIVSHLIRRKKIDAGLAIVVTDFHVLGYTTEMHDWMSVADLIIGKPGGLTTSEALAKALPMIVYQAVPGQEEFNSDYLLENGVALKCNDLTTLAYKVDRLLKDPNRLRAMRERASQLARPDAARTIVDTLLEDLNQKRTSTTRDDRQIEPRIVAFQRWLSGRNAPLHDQSNQVQG